MPLAPMHFFVTKLDIVIAVLCLINAILLFTGMGRFAMYNAIDSVLHLFLPKLSLKYNYRKYFPRFTKTPNGEIMPAFQTSRDEYFPSYGPFFQRVSDFLLRFPLFTLSLFILLAPFILGVFGPYIQEVMRFLHSRYPAMPLTAVQPATSPYFRLFAILFFLPFSSIHATQISLYAIVIYPVLVFFKSLSFSYKYIKELVPALCFSCLFLLLFAVEVTLVYVGFLPMFHQGLTPFVENAAGLKQLVFWFPVKIKIFIDFILAPVVVVVPLVTSLGSYILAKSTVQGETDETNYLVLFYKTGIAYLYGPLLGLLFPRLKAESKVVRNERRINEILVVGMYFESGVCIAGTGYAYLALAKTAQIPLSGIIMGLMVLMLFIPLIIFSSNGFQSFFLDKATIFWMNLKKAITGHN